MYRRQATDRLSLNVSLLRYPVPQLIGIVSGLLLLCWPSPFTFGQSITPTSTDHVTISVGSNVVRSYANDKLLLGFNLEASGFQESTPGESNLWDSRLKAVRPEFYDFLKSDFNGAVYRYPGGTNASYFDWYRSIGDSAFRQANPAFAEYGSYTADFGIDEFMSFVSNAHGIPQIVLNMYRKDGAVISESDWPSAVKNLLGLLEYCNAPANEDWNGDGIMQGKLRADNGHPAPYNVTRWELGNELDHGGALTKEAYVNRCRDVITAFNQHPIPGHPYIFMPNAATSIMGVDNWRDWHKYVLSKLGNSISSLVWHPYYDGYSIPWHLSNAQTIAADIDNWAAGSTSAKPTIATTEHAKWPDDLGNKDTWPSTTGISGAISTSDMIISLEQRPYMSEALYHCLAMWGPWALFLPIDSKGSYVWGYTHGGFAPRPAAYALKLIHRTMQHADILGTTIVTPGKSGYGDHAYYPNCLYDVRATGYRYGINGAAGILAVNRSSSDYPLTLALPGWTSGKQIVRMEGVGGDEEAASGLWKRYFTVTVNKQSGNLILPTLGVFAIIPVGADLAINGNFESGALNHAPPKWELRSTGQHWNSAIVEAPQGVDHRHLRIDGDGTELSLVQSSVQNRVLGPTGILAANPNDMYVLRANMRASGGSGNATVSVRIFNARGNQCPNGEIHSTTSATDAHGKWTPLALEFEPSSCLAGDKFGNAEIAINVRPVSGSCELDGITLQRRKNWMTNPDLIRGHSASYGPDAYLSQKAISSTKGVEKYVRILANGQLTQNSTNNFALGPYGTAVSRDNERWRFRARVRYTNLGGNGARLKVKIYSSYGIPRVVYSACPLTGSHNRWSDAALEFTARDYVSPYEVTHLEVSIENGSSTGFIDVCHLSLEALD